MGLPPALGSAKRERRAPAAGWVWIGEHYDLPASSRLAIWYVQVGDCFIGWNKNHCGLWFLVTNMTLSYLEFPQSAWDFACLNLVAYNFYFLLSFLPWCKKNEKDQGQSKHAYPAVRCCLPLWKKSARSGEVVDYHPNASAFPDLAAFFSFTPPPAAGLPGLTRGYRTVEIVLLVTIKTMWILILLVDEILNYLLFFLTISWKECWMKSLYPSEPR